MLLRAAMGFSLFETLLMAGVLLAWADKVAGGRLLAAFLAGIAFPKIPVTGAQLIASIPPEVEIVLLHGDGANYLTREQLAWFRRMPAMAA